jgi:hypothetical protein
MQPITVRGLLAKVETMALDGESETPTEPRAEQSARSQLYGRYLGQIDARIERAWLRPRTPIGSPSFSCTVQVEQDGAGWIKDIMLVRCNGDVRWQQSLVRAIQASSPLPAPPNPRVFKSHLLLIFRAEAYSDTSDPYLYEAKGIVDHLPRPDQ